MIITERFVLTAVSCGLLLTSTSNVYAYTSDTRVCDIAECHFSLGAILRQNAELGRLNEDLEEEVSSLNYTITSLTEESAAINGKYTNLLLEQEDLVTERDYLKNKNLELLEKNRDLLADMDVLKADKDALQEEKAILLSKDEELAASNAKLLIKNQQLTLEKNNFVSGLLAICSDKDQKGVFVSIEDDGGVRLLRVSQKQLKKYVVENARENPL